MLACGPAAQAEAPRPAGEESSQTANPSAAQHRDYRGICDGSAAVALDGEFILVAYDEENVLYAFAAAGGGFTAARALSGLLKLPGRGEIDIEAATRVGPRIWWIGSHGLDRDGDDAPNRRVLFATNHPARDLNDLETLVPARDLTNVLLSAPEVAKILTPAARKRPPKKGGVNIEGLAAGPDGGLMVGFRSPLSGVDGQSGQALVVHLTPRGETFEVQKSALLDLDERGIRAIANDGAGYLIAAGSGGGKQRPALYRWNGRDAPRLLAETPDLNIEAIVDMGDGWLVLSDDGKTRRPDDGAHDGDRKCDKIRKKNSRHGHHPSVYFRGAIVPKAAPTS